MRQRAMRLLLGGLVASVMAACGGGGDSQPPAAAVGPPEPRAESSTPLQLREGAQTQAAQVPLIYAESLLALGADVLLWLDALPASPDASNTLPCLLGGSRTVRWTDVDRNGVLGPGDVAELSLADCGAPASQLLLRGALRAELVQRSSESTLARLMLGSGIAFSAAGVQFTWLGGFEAGTSTPAERRADLFARSAPADAVRVVLEAQGQRAVDRIDAFDIRRSSDLDARVNTSTVLMALVSDVLGGSLGLSTPIAARAYFDTFPQAGTFEVRGADALRVLGGGGEDRAQIQVLSGATAGQAIDRHWTDLMPGLLWVAPGATLPNAYAAVRPLADVPFAFVGGPRARAAPQARQVDWMFSRELNVPQLVAQLHRVESGAPSGWGSSSVSARVAISGARATLSWDEPLEPGRSYQVVWLDAANGNVVPFLSSQDGLSLWGQDAQIDVADTVRASVQRIGAPLLVPGGTVEFDATASSADAAGGLAYRWRQVGGNVPVTFSSATQARTTLQIPAMPGAPAEEVAIELEVTDAQGTIDRERVSLLLVPSPATSLVARFVGAPGAPLFGGQEVAVGDEISPDTARWRSANPTDLLRIAVTPPSSELTLLWFSLPAGVPLQPGTYHAPVDIFNRVDTASMHVLHGNTSCNQPNGEFTIHEFQLGSPDGVMEGTPVTKLALDFQVSCAGSPLVRGFVRLASAVALP